MNSLIDSRLTGVTIALCLLGFHFLGVVFAPRLLFLEITNGMLAALGLTVACIYGMDAPKHFRAGNDRAAWIRSGIALAWIVACSQALGRVYFIEFRPSVSGRTFDALFGLPALGYILAAVAHIIAIGVIGRQVPRRNICVVGWTLAGGAGAVLALRWIHTNLF